MRACKKSAPFDPIWPRLARLALLAPFCPVGPFLASFCLVWPRFAPFDSFGHHLAPFGPDWTNLAMIEHSSILISRYFKVPIREGAGPGLVVHLPPLHPCHFNLLWLVLLFSASISLFSCLHNSNYLVLFLLVRPMLFPFLSLETVLLPRPFLSSLFPSLLL